MGFPKVNVIWGSTILGVNDFRGLFDFRVGLIGFAVDAGFPGLQDFPQRGPT